jgi:single-strand DNA-binding protein
MTLAKANVSGTVYRAPEKRFTQNDIAIYGLTLNIDEREETLIRVISKRKSLADVLDRVKKGDKILVDGRLQVATSKAQDGSDRKYFEIDASDIEILSGSGSASVSSTSSSDDIVQFGEFEVNDVTDAPAEDTLIDEEEIPF